MSEFEFNIQTNDGWVVSLLSDVEINLHGVQIRSIIVQPKEEFDKRVAADNSNVQRKPYKLVPAYESPKHGEVW